MYNFIVRDQHYFVFLLHLKPALMLSKNRFNRCRYDSHQLGLVARNPVYNKPIRSTLFNFNKIVNDLDIDFNTPAS